VAYPGAAKIFSVFPIISGMGRATNFTFSTHVLSINRKKISGKVAVGVVRTFAIFQGTYILGASRGRLCDSSAFLLLPCVVLLLQTTRIVSLVHHLGLELLGLDLTQFELGQECLFLSRKAGEESEGRQGCWQIDALVVAVLFTGQVPFLIAQSASIIKAS